MNYWRDTQFPDWEQLNAMISLPSVILVFSCLWLSHLQAYSVSEAGVVRARIHQLVEFRNSAYQRLVRIEGSLQDESPVDSTFPSVGNSDMIKVRRVRYSGSYPKAFKERYKEIRGDADTISKVLAKGSTPAGTHVPIMIEEVLHHLGLNETLASVKKMKSCLSVDCTLGFGGHSTEIVRRISPLKNWMHFGIDQDVVEIARTKERVINSFTSTTPEIDIDVITRRISFHNQNFGDIEDLAKAQGFCGKVNILMADLGYSSMQIDDPLRGFTFKAEGPLDMRMDPTKGETALEFLHRIKRNELIKILEENSDEIMALQIATCLKEDPIPVTTVELSERVRKTVRAAEMKRGGEAPTKDMLDSAVARTMQAIRIEVNGEFRVLEKLLEALPRVMAPGGRVVFLTFHSGWTKMFGPQTMNSLSFD